VIASEPVEQPLARLRDAIERAESELACLRRAYAQLATEAKSLIEDEERQWQKTYLLSRQESRVACLVAKGLSNDQIAQLQHVSVHTVKTQVKSILFKLAVHSRWQVASALERERSIENAL
jgi:DNA-binding NarL/FixJ family response regulator